MFFIIGIWGGPERRYARRSSSVHLRRFVFTLAVVIWLGLKQSADRAEGCSRLGFDMDSACASPRRCRHTCGFWLLLGAFRIRGEGAAVPSTPGCRWRNTEAPTAGSVILAGATEAHYGSYKLAVPIGSSR